MYYRGAAAAIIVYDISRASTFKTLKNWVDELKNQGPKDIAIAIAGNKSDLEESREIDRAMAQAYAEEIGALYLETSAKDDVNVQDIFVQLSNRLPAPPTADTTAVRTNATRLKQQAEQANVQKGCC
jgi:GTPase SAR1 family protein